MDEKQREVPLIFRMAGRVWCFYVFNTGKRYDYQYIKNQKEHHRHETFRDEYKRLLEEQGIEFDEKYLV